MHSGQINLVYDFMYPLQDADIILPRQRYQHLYLLHLQYPLLHQKNPHQMLQGNQ